MAQTVIVGRDEPARQGVEAFIAGLYLRAYQATGLEFPDRLIVATDRDGEILCAAGLRTAEDGFFSEVYLDVAVETMLSGLCQRSVARRDIFEISTFASRAPALVPAFVEEIICFGVANGFSWSFFTATSRLQRMAQRLGFANAQTWRCGSATSPACRAMGQLLPDAARRICGHQDGWKGRPQSNRKCLRCDRCLKGWWRMRAPTEIPSPSATGGRRCRAMLSSRG